MKFFSPIGYWNNMVWHVLMYANSFTITAKSVYGRIHVRKLITVICFHKSSVINFDGRLQVEAQYSIDPRIANSYQSELVEHPELEHDPWKSEFHLVVNFNLLKKIVNEVQLNNDKSEVARCELSN